MGLIAGICSRDQSDVSELLYKMTMKLRHRGNSGFCAFRKEINGGEMIPFENPKELLSLETSFGIVGRHFFLNQRDEEIPYTDCREKRFLLMDGAVLNLTQIKQELNETHRDNITSPSLLLHLLEELQTRVFDFSAIFGKLFNLIDGMFAAVLILKQHVFLFRDLVGIKPLYLYSGPKYIAFASEKKALWAAGLTRQITPLQPGRVVRFGRKGITSHFQAEFIRGDPTKNPSEFYRDHLLGLLKSNIQKLNPQTPFYLLLSGGIDSTLLAAVLKECGLAFNSLVIGSRKSKDILIAQKAADGLGLPLETLEFDSSTLEAILPALLYAVESRDEKKVNIAFPLFYAAKHLSEKEHNIVVTGQGADEVFGGYKRHEVQYQTDPNTLNEKLWEDVKKLYDVNLQRDDAASMAHSVELRLPYLTRNLIEFSMQIPASLKIQGTTRKYILRQIGKKLGLHDAIIQQPKRAIQFSSGSYLTLKKLAKNLGFTKDFTLKHGFFSPTQLFIDALAYFLGFPDLDPHVVKFVEETPIQWPDSYQKYRDIVNKLS